MVPCKQCSTEALLLIHELFAVAEVLFVFYKIK